MEQAGLRMNVEVAVDLGEPAARRPVHTREPVGRVGDKVPDTRDGRDEVDHWLALQQV